MGQLLGDILVIAVFIQLFIVLSLYIGRTIYDYIKTNKTKKTAHEPERK